MKRRPERLRQKATEVFGSPEPAASELRFNPDRDVTDADIEQAMKFIQQARDNDEYSKIMVLAAAVAHFRPELRKQLVPTYMEKEEINTFGLGEGISTTQSFLLEHMSALFRILEPEEYDEETYDLLSPTMDTIKAGKKEVIQRLRDGDVGPDAYRFLQEYACIDPSILKKVKFTDKLVQEMKGYLERSKQQGSIDPRIVRAIYLLAPQLRNEAPLSPEQWELIHDKQESLRGTPRYLPYVFDMAVLAAEHAELRGRGDIVMTPTSKVLPPSSPLPERPAL